MTVKASSLAAEEGEKGMFVKDHQARRSVGKGHGLVHIQVLRIRKEDSYIGEDDGRVSGFMVLGEHQRREMLKLCCRKASELELPCSPLGERGYPRST